MTKKLRKYDKEHSHTLPPFFNTLRSMEEKQYFLFKDAVIQFLSLIKNDWPTVRRINELWLSKNYKFLPKEVGRFLPTDKFPMDNELEYLRGVHQINLIFFSCLLDMKRFRQNTVLPLREITALCHKDTGKVIDLVSFFEGKELLHQYESKIFKQFEQFVEIFSFLIPVFSIKFYKKVTDTLFKENGITTTSFEDIKQFYIDSYEVAGEVLFLVLALNNLKYRANFEKMAEKRKDIKTLSDLNSKSKGTRIEFLEGKEEFDRLVFPYLDNHLRNAIGHSSYVYDGIKQIIQYYPSGEMNKGKMYEIYLLEFCMNCWDLFLSIFDLGELIYQTRKITFLLKGCKPIDPSLFQ